MCIGGTGQGLWKELPIQAVPPSAVECFPRGLEYPPYSRTRTTAVVFHGGSQRPVVGGVALPVMVILHWLG